MNLLINERTNEQFNDKNECFIKKQMNELINERTNDLSLNDRMILNEAYECINQRTIERLIGRTNVWSIIERTNELVNETNEGSIIE